MPDTEIRELKREQWQMNTCPVWVHMSTDEDDDTDVVPCGASLEPIVVRSIVGDDYGSWTTYSVSFECGHTFEQMEHSLGIDP